MEPDLKEDLEELYAIWYFNQPKTILRLCYSELCDKYPDKDIKQELINLGLWNSSMKEFID